MKTTTLPYLICILIFAFSATSFAQNNNADVKALFAQMKNDRMKIVQENNFTLSEIEELDNIMKTSGDKLFNIIKGNPGITHQYIIDEIDGEFDVIKDKFNKVFVGIKLTLLTQMVTENRTAIFNKLVENGNAQGIRTSIRAGARTNIRVGIRVGLRAGIRAQLRAGLRTNIIKKVEGK